MRPALDRELLSFFAVCPRGLEPVLAAELEALGASAVTEAAGGVAFCGSASVGYGANLHSRVASRVLRRVIEGRYRNDDDIYKIAVRAPWEQFLSPQLTLRVDLNATRSPLRSLNFATLRVKDGIVDRLRQACGDRPSIDTETPDARVFAYLDERQATLYLDWSGEPLFKRGWRGEVDAKGDAPIKENLAAGLLALSGWKPGDLLLDPFCGSGTIVIEAAQIAAGLPPGLNRPFGFERLLDFDEPLWLQLREQVRRSTASGERARTTLFASDIDREAIAQARQNLRRAGLSESAVRFETQPAQQLRPPSAPEGFDAARLIISNPPYGERIDLHDSAPRGRSRDQSQDQGRDHSQGHSRDHSRDHSRRDSRGRPDHTEALLRSLGAHWKAHYLGWSINLLSSDRQLPSRLGLKEQRKTPLYNGALECRLFAFRMFERREAAATE